MARTIKKVEFLPKMPKLLNVAAYARVSSDKHAAFSFRTGKLLQ